MGFRETVLPSCWFEGRLRVRFAVPTEKRPEFIQHLRTPAEGLPIAAQLEWEVANTNEPNQTAVYAANVLVPTSYPSPYTHPKPPGKHLSTAESGIRKTRNGFIQGYTAPAAVDADHQVIVAQGLTNRASDVHQLEPPLTHLRRNTGRQARELSADAGYCSEQNLKTLDRRHVRGYVATGRQRHGEASAASARKPVPQTRIHAMKIRLKRVGYHNRYRLRKQVSTQFRNVLFLPK